MLRISSHPDEARVSYEQIEIDPHTVRLEVTIETGPADHPRGLVFTGSLFAGGDATFQPDPS